MLHDEMWQEFAIENGERLETAGRESKLDNPELDTDDAYVGTSAVWVYRRTDAGVEVLFQKRSENVSNAGKWDVSAGGHVNVGESEAAAAARELYEEIGIKVDEKDLIFVFRLRSFFKVKLYINYFLYDFTGREDEFNFGDREVSEVRWVKLEDFDKFIDAGAKDVIKKAEFTRGLSKLWLERYGDIEK